LPHPSPGAGAQKFFTAQTTVVAITNIFVAFYRSSRRSQVDCDRSGEDSRAASLSVSHEEKLASLTSLGTKLPRTYSPFRFRSYSWRLAIKGTTHGEATRRYDE
jgi:hypothetical protein